MDTNRKKQLQKPQIEAVEIRSLDILSGRKVDAVWCCNSAQSLYKQLQSAIGLEIQFKTVDEVEEQINQLLIEQQYEFYFAKNVALISYLDSQTKIIPTSQQPDHLSIILDFLELITDRVVLHTEATLLQELKRKEISSPDFYAFSHALMHLYPQKYLTTCH